MDLFFPRKKIKIKYTDGPWISSYIKRRIRARKNVYTTKKIDQTGGEKSRKKRMS